ncbi:MAG: hypothetical protein VX212_01300 [Pseudomonadota bacterium]|nr:hypothetical protein [Pseudomonadota bacterium]
MKKLLGFTAVLLLVPQISFANTCSLPTSLDGLEFITLSNPLYSKSQTNAGTLGKMSFKSATYDFDALNSTTSYTANYNYQVVGQNNDVAIIDASTTQGKTLNYTYTLKCKDDKTGTIIFTSDSLDKQNTLIYAID